jgi:ligand-binding sensor domain-containing protein
MRGIFIYFLFVFCLLLKDGVSLAIYQLREKEEMATSQELALEDSMEEDVPDDFFASDESALVIDQIKVGRFFSSKDLPPTSESELNVLLEQVSPPPRLA